MRPTRVSGTAGSKLSGANFVRSMRSWMNFKVQITDAAVEDLARLTWQGILGQVLTYNLTKEKLGSPCA